MKRACDSSAQEMTFRSTCSEVRSTKMYSVLLNRDFIVASDDIQLSLVIYEAKHIYPKRAANAEVVVIESAGLGPFISVRELGMLLLENIDIRTGD